MDNLVREIIIKYGAEVIRTEDFKKTFSQTHHRCSTVGDHTLGVAAEGVKFCLRHGIRDKESLSNVVHACLCHDLGILGRAGKFRNNFECLQQHPKHSSERYLKLFGKRNERVTDAILYHMFPLRLHAPKYKEGWILVLADKIASVKERLGRTEVTEEDIRIIMERAGADD